MPYGQEIIQNQDLAQAMANQQMLQQRQQAAQGLMQTNGSAGWAGILGSALGGYMNKKKGDQLAQGDADISRQIQAIQEAEKQRIAEALQAKEIAEIKRKDFEWNRENQAKVEAASKTQKGTIAMQNAASMGLQPGTPQYNDYVMKATGKAGTVINNNTGSKEPEFGTIPPGHMLLKNDSGGYEMQPVSGSPASRDIKQSEDKIHKTAGQMLADFNNIDAVGNEVLSQIGFGTSGIIGSKLSSIYQPSADMASNLDTLRADATFSKLQSIRENSPTGGAVGNMSDNEGRLMGAAQAALNQEQSPEQLKTNVKRYLDIRKGVIDRYAEDYKTDYGYYPDGYQSPNEQQSSQGQSQPSPQVQQMSDEDIMRALNGG